MKLERWHLSPFPSTVAKPGTLLTLCVYPMRETRCHGIVFAPLTDCFLTDLRVGQETVFINSGRIPTGLLTQECEHFAPHSVFLGHTIAADVLNAGRENQTIAGAFLLAETDPELERERARHAEQIERAHAELTQANGRIADLIARMYPPKGPEPKL